MRHRISLSSRGELTGSGDESSAAGTSWSDSCTASSRALRRLRVLPAALRRELGGERMLTILIVLLVLLLVGSAPGWPHSRNWGYYPSGGLGLVLLVVVILLLTGRI
jgi:hypothetical protein